MAGEEVSEPERPNGPVFCSGFSNVRDLELTAIARRWREQGLSPVDGTKLCGIAISGGGIRSASFSLGVVQKLAHEGIVREAHYLSTVSGGGYTGSSLTWYLSRGVDGRPCYTTERERFPFLGGQAAANRRRDRRRLDQPQQDRPPPDGRTIIDFIRQRSSYLIPGRGLGLLSAFGIVLRSILTSLFAYFLLFTLLWLLLDALGVVNWKAGPAHLTTWSALVPLVLLVATTILYSIFAPSPWLERFSYRVRRGYQEMIGVWLGWTLALALFGAWLLAVNALISAEPRAFGIDAPEAAGSATLGGALLGLLRKKLGEAAPRFLSWLLPVLPPLALFLLLAGLGTLGALAADVLANGEKSQLSQNIPPLSPIWLWGGVAFSLLYLLYANINLTGLHRFYRDRLMETFLPDLDDVHHDLPSTETSANSAELWKMFDPRSAGPYHLVNANMVMLDSGTARFRSRKSDSFVLAPHYCGSEATGWARTDQWLADRGPNVIRPVGAMTLATAMAISGAAVNPNTGVGGRGVTKTAAVSALLTILNIRLGHWALSPSKLEEGRRRRPFAFPPNFVFPGLVQGIFGWGRTDRSDWLELTDGGHFDNLGLYELVRRRVRTIYAIDGTEDQDTAFSSFANAAEKIYIDFNVRLSFRDERGFIKLMRGADPEENPLNKAFRLAERGFTVGTVEYPGLRDKDGHEIEKGFIGTIYYIKSTLTKGLPEALYSYRAENPSFPSQSTADQFFDEQQFEAYRTLGFALAAQLTDHLASARNAAAGPEADGAGGQS